MGIILLAHTHPEHMIGDTTLDGGYGTGVSLSVEDAANLRKAGKWARFVGIVGMVFTALGLIFVVGFSSTMMAMAGLDDFGGGAGAGIFFIIFYGAMLAFGFYMVYLLYKFGAKAMEAVDANSSVATSESLFSLARFFKIYGVLMAIYIGFVLLGLIFAVIGGAFAALG